MLVCVKSVLMVDQARRSAVAHPVRDLAYSRYGQGRMGSVRRQAALAVPLPAYRATHHSKISTNFLSV